jgi:hypothetical protein
MNHIRIAATFAAWLELVWDTIWLKVMTSIRDCSHSTIERRGAQLGLVIKAAQILTQEGDEQ